MIVDTRHGRILLVTHAVRRFRQRVRAGATVADLATAVRCAQWHELPPPWVHDRGPHMSPRGPDDRAVGWLVAKGWAMPVYASSKADWNALDFDFAAVTCLTRRRRSKEEVRLLRAEREEAQSWAA